MKLSNLSLTVDSLDLSDGTATVGGVTFQLLPNQDAAMRKLISSQLPTATMLAPSVPKAPKAAKVAPASEPGTRIRRSAEQIEAAGERIFAHVEANQGAKSEDIRSALGMEKNEWTLTIGKLVEAGRLTTKGEKRAMQYFTKGKRRAAK